MGIGKKALALTTLMTLVITGVIFIITSKAVADASDLTDVVKEFYAKDIALTLDTLTAVPGAVVFQYRGNFTKLLVTVENDEVKLRNDRNDPNGKRWFFVPFQEKPNLIDSYHTELLILERKGERLGLLGDLQDEITCPTSDTSKSTSDFSILIDPFGNDGRKEKTNYESTTTNVLVTEGELTSTAAEYFTTDLVSFKEKKMTRFSDEHATPDERMILLEEMKPDIYLGIGVGENINPETSQAIIYTGIDPVSKGIGCQIKKRMLVPFSESAIIVVPTMDKRFEHAKVNILVEIGNIRNDNDPILGNAGEAGRAIYKGIEAYYDS